MFCEFCVDLFWYLCPLTSHGCDLHSDQRNEETGLVGLVDTARGGMGFYRWGPVVGVVSMGCQRADRSPAAGGRAGEQALSSPKPVLTTK